MLTLIVFIAILSILVFVHELGHFLVAKRAGIKVEEFGFGFPPRAFGIKKGETIYSLNWIPIGGFVRLYGEEEEEKKEKGRAFYHKPKKIRILVILAGVVMNFVLAVLVFSAVYTKTGIPTKTDQVKVVGLVASSPADTAGLKDGDLVIMAGGEKIKDSQDFVTITQKLVGREMEIEIVREGEKKVFKVRPRENPPAGEGPLGVVISSVEMKFYPIWEMPVRGALEGFKEALAWTSLIVGALGAMFWQLVSAGTVPKDVAGPVGIFQVTGQVAQGGILNILQFLGILSVNLAVINILPIPALDGGRLLFIGIEAITGKRIKAKVERWTHQIGMMLLLFLILLITYNDIVRILGTTSIGDRLRGLF